MKKVALIVALSIAVYHLTKKMYEIDPQGTFNLIFLIFMLSSMFLIGAFLGANLHHIEAWVKIIKNYKTPAQRRKEVEVYLRDLAIVQKFIQGKDYDLREIDSNRFMLLKRGGKQKHSRIQIGNENSQVVLVSHTGLVNRCDLFNISEIKQILKA